MSLSRQLVPLIEELGRIHYDLREIERQEKEERVELPVEYADIRDRLYNLTEHLQEVGAEAHDVVLELD